MKNKHLTASNFKLTNFEQLQSGVNLALTDKKWMLIYSHGLPKPCMIELTGQYASKDGDAFTHLGGYRDRNVYSPYLDVNYPLMSLQAWVIAYPIMGPNGPIGRAGAVTIEKGAYISDLTDWKVNYSKPGDYAITLGPNCDVIEFWFAINSPNPETMMLHKDDPARFIIDFL